MPRTIQETLTVQIDDIDEDYPHQFDDYRLLKLRKDLVAFIYRFVSQGTDSPAEEAVVRLGVACDLFHSVNAQAEAELLRERLMRR